MCSLVSVMKNVKMWSAVSFCGAGLEVYCFASSELSSTSIFCVCERQCYKRQESRVQTHTDTIITLKASGRDCTNNNELLH